MCKLLHRAYSSCKNHFESFEHNAFNPMKWNVLSSSEEEKTIDLYNKERYILLSPRWMWANRWVINGDRGVPTKYIILLIEKRRTPSAPKKIKHIPKSKTAIRHTDNKLAPLTWEMFAKSPFRELVKYW